MNVDLKEYSDSKKCHLPHIITEIDQPVNIAKPKFIYLSNSSKSICLGEYRQVL